MTKHEVKAAPIGMRVVVADWLVRYRGNDITGDSRHVWGQMGQGNTTQRLSYWVRYPAKRYA